MNGLNRNNPSSHCFSTGQSYKNSPTKSSCLLPNGFLLPSLVKSWCKKFTSLKIFSWAWHAYFSRLAVATDCSKTSLEGSWPKAIERKDCQNCSPFIYQEGSSARTDHGNFLISRFTDLQYAGHSFDFPTPACPPIQTAALVSGWHWEPSWQILNVLSENLFNTSSVKLYFLQNQFQYSHVFNDLQWSPHVTWKLQVKHSNSAVFSELLLLRLEGTKLRLWLCSCFSCHI